MKKSKNNKKLFFYFPLNREEKESLKALPELEKKVLELALIEDIVYLSINEGLITIWSITSTDETLEKCLRIFEQ